MMKFIPTMNFNGQCREAMEMYRKAFGGMVTAAGETMKEGTEKPTVWGYELIG